MGLSTSDSYATTYAKATAILKGFQGLGANTVRMPFNAATTSGSWWGSYTGALDAAAALGMNVVVAPWLQNGTVSNTTAFYAMWDVMINKYVGNNHFYFEIMNEPWGMTAAAEDNFSATWVAHYFTVPMGRILVPGAYSTENLCTVGADSRLNGTLLSIHKYTLGGETHPTEAAWITAINQNICGYASRAVFTEFGVPMNTGVNYDGPRDGTNNVSYLYAITDNSRNLGMGTIIWVGVKGATQTAGPGPCFNASCAITSLQGSGTNLSLTVNNRSGLDRLQYGWGGSGPAGGTVLRSSASNRCLDVIGASTASGTQTEIWDCNGGANQSFALNAAKELVVYGSQCLDASGGGTTAGTKVVIAACTGASHQQWTLNAGGTVTNGASGLCLDVTGAATAAGTLVELWGCNGGSNQLWTRQ